MAGLVPAIHVFFRCGQDVVPGTRPGMTITDSGPCHIAFSVLRY
jgi:hypothetical protein